MIYPLKSEKSKRSSSCHGEICRSWWNLPSNISGPSGRPTFWGDVHWGSFVVRSIIKQSQEYIDSKFVLLQVSCWLSGALDLIIKDCGCLPQRRACSLGCPTCLGKSAWKQHSLWWEKLHCFQQCQETQTSSRLSGNNSRKSVVQARFLSLMRICHCWYKAWM